MIAQPNGVTFISVYLIIELRWTLKNLVMLPSQFLFHEINEVQFYINFRCLWTTHVWFNPWKKRAVGTQVHSGIFWEMQALWTGWCLVYRIWSYKQRYCQNSSFLITITSTAILELISFFFLVSTCFVLLFVWLFSCHVVALPKPWWSY